MSEEPTITISLEEYLELKAASDFLDCLSTYGVDNWEGYDLAQDLFSSLPGER